MTTQYNLNLNGSVELKSTIATNEMSPDSITIKLVLIPLKEGNQTITI